MAEIFFMFNGIQTRILCQKDELMKDICQKFSNKINIDINNLYFLYGGENIKEELKLNQQAKKIDLEQNQMNILVYERNNIIKNNSVKIKSKEIICPKCGENCRISFKNYKIKLYKCKNNHKITNISLIDFKKSQYLDESKIICQDCNINNKQDSYNNSFFKCLTCSNNLCPLCSTKHNKTHKIIDYNRKNYICYKHKDLFFSYCKQCKIDLCMECETEHNCKTHKIIYYKDMIINKEKIKEMFDNFGKKYENLQKIIKYIFEILNKINKNIESFYEISKDIINNYEIQNRNYKILKNINEIYNNIKLNNIDKIINDNNIGNQFSNLINIYNKINEKDNELSKEKEGKNNDNSKDKNSNNKINKEMVNNDNNTLIEKNEITCIYKIDKQNSKLKIFGSGFVKNNAQNCKINIENKEYVLADIFIIPKEILLFKEELSIKLTGIDKITSMRNLFSGCNLLISLPDISEINTSKITDMGYMFSGCSSLSNLPDISKWNTDNISNMSLMFSGCMSLSNLPDISKWNLINVKNMTGLFNGCSSLYSLPDISKWNTSNVTNMSCMFFGCTSLTNLPDISKWDTSNVISINCMFFNCSSLKKFPDISKWNISNVKNMNDIFKGCKMNIKFKNN